MKHVTGAHSDSPLGLVVVAAAAGALGDSVGLDSWR